MKKGVSTYKPIVENKHSRATSLEEVEIIGEEGKFFKGYGEDGRPVYVPASNLESMKTLINLNQKRRDSSNTSVPVYSTEKKELEKYIGKLEHLVEKLDSMPLEYDDDIEEIDERESSVTDSKLTQKSKRNSRVKKRKQKIYSIYKIEISIRKFKQKCCHCKDKVKSDKPLGAESRNLLKKSQDFSTVTQENRKCVPELPEKIEQTKRFGNKDESLKTPVSPSLKRYSKKQHDKISNTPPRKLSTRILDYCHFL